MNWFQILKMLQHAFFSLILLFLRWLLLLLVLSALTLTLALALALLVRSTFRNIWIWQESRFEKTVATFLRLRIGTSRWFGHSIRSRRHDVFWDFLFSTFIKRSFQSHFFLSFLTFLSSILFLLTFFLFINSFSIFYTCNFVIQYLNWTLISYFTKLARFTWIWTLARFINLPNLLTTSQKSVLSKQVHWLVVLIWIPFFSSWCIWWWCFLFTTLLHSWIFFIGVLAKCIQIVFLHRKDMLSWLVFNQVIQAQLVLRLTHLPFTILYNWWTLTWIPCYWWYRSLMGNSWNLLIRIRRLNVQN